MLHSCLPAQRASLQQHRNSSSHGSSPAALDVGCWRKSHGKIRSRMCPGSCKTHAAHLVWQLVETNTMTELSSGPNRTGLACLECIHGLIAEIASSCNAGNVGGDAATSFVAIPVAAAAAHPLCCPGLREAEDTAFLPPRAPPAAGVVAEGKSQAIHERAGTTLENRRGGKIPPSPHVFFIWAPNCHQS